MARILIDGRFVGVGDSMTRYCLEVVKGVLELDKENDYVMLVRPIGKKLLSELEGNQNLQIEVMDIPHYSFSEQTKLLKYLNKEKFDLVHFIQFNHPTRYKGKFVVTVHDLTLLGHLYRQKLHKRIAFGAVMKSAVKKSSNIITISETSKQEIVEYYGVEPDKITVTYLAVDGKYNNRIKDSELRIQQFKEKYGIAGEYFLYTGMWKKHKNLTRLLKAYEVFVNRECERGYSSKFPQLVLVGKIDKEEPEVMALVDEINQRILKTDKRSANSCDDLKPVITTGFVDEGELPIAYAGALTYIIPSLSEGFGLPPLEAMACGTPVLSSNVSAMPEILGEAPLYFDPYDVDDIAKKMQQMASDEHLRAELSAKGLEQVKKYDWVKTAKQTLEVYKSILFE